MMRFLGVTDYSGCLSFYNFRFWLCVLTVPLMLSCTDAPGKASVSFEQGTQPQSLYKKSSSQRAGKYHHRSCTTWYGDAVIKRQCDLWRFSNKTEILGNLVIANSSLVDLAGLEGLKNITGRLVIRNNKYLTDITALQNVENIGRSIQIIKNPSLRLMDFGGLQKLGRKNRGLFKVVRNESLRQCDIDVSIAQLREQNWKGHLNSRHNSDESCGECEDGPCCDSGVYVAAGTVCRESAGACDVQETCTGLDSACPGDDLIAEGTQCRAAINVCDDAESCDGVTAQCPADTYDASAVSENDATCDGIDDDCDGIADDDYEPVAMECGDGVCVASGTVECEEGATVEQCTPGAPQLVADTTCNGIDEDCDGSIDEDFVGETVFCGIGACVASGVQTCAGGSIGEECTPLAGYFIDSTCDLVDDDCDGSADEDFGVTSSTCGTGDCESQGEISCSVGQVVDSCVVGESTISCDSQNANCGDLNNGCGETLACGSCVEPETCGGLGVANQCGYSDLPPDPVDVASEIDPTVATTVFDSTRFIYEGDNPIQTGVVEGIIDVQRASVVKGEVFDRFGMPVSGVEVTVLNHPEYGETLTRSDGAFDIVVNGGSALVLDFFAEEYLSVQRQVDVAWSDITYAKKVALTALDVAVTSVDLNDATEIQVAQGSAVVDDDGERQPTLIFSPGTSGTMIMADGSEVSVDSLSVRATEYTVGEDGPEAMPAELPPQSGYTYCVELSADEAIAAGATSVEFDQPVAFYVENFLNFPVGGIVPVGFYDRTEGVWVASENGRVIEVLSVSNGVVEVDCNGDGAADNELSIPNEELQRLAGLYEAGQTLWRAEMAHFTPWDCNWPYGPDGENDTPPEQPDPEVDEEKDGGCNLGGCTIEAQNQILGEEIPLVGTPISLVYRSNLMPGYSANRNLNISLSSESLPINLKKINLDVTIAGQKQFFEFSPSENLSHSFSWDGRDGYGRYVTGRRSVNTRISYVYDAVYLNPSDFARSFASFGTTAMSGNRARQEVSLSQINATEVGSPSVMLGGWRASLHHQYDVKGKLLQMGTGERVSRDSLGTAFSTVAGDGYGSNKGDGGQATDARIYAPDALAVAADGSIYLASSAAYIAHIRKIDPDGIITTIAGTSRSGFSGDGGLATAAQLESPQGLAITRSGELIIADTGNHRLRKIDSNGIITTIAGTGSVGYGGDGGPALEARIFAPQDVAVGFDGSIYIADNGNSRVRKISTDGLISTVAGNGARGFAGDGGQAIEAELYYPRGIAVDGDGTLYIAEYGNHRIRKVTPEGIISTIAGNGIAGFAGDGGPAMEASLYGPAGVTIAANGTLIIADYSNNRIRQVSKDGIITTLAGNGTTTYNGDNRSPTSSAVDHPTRTTIDNNGNVYIADNFARLRKTGIPFPGYGPEELLIASSDLSKVYVFDSQGRHLRTTNADSGQTLYSFEYDAAHRLSAIVDAFGEATSFERNNAGELIGVLAPNGQHSTLVVNGDGYLESVMAPNGDAVQMEYDGDSGLLTGFINARGNKSDYVYSDTGKLLEAHEPGESYQTLSALKEGARKVVTRITAMGRATAFSIEENSDESEKWINTFPDGTQRTLYQQGASTQTVMADGTVSYVTNGPDPRFGMQAPIVASSIAETPSGIISEVTSERVVELDDSSNPFSLISQTDTVTRNGNVTTIVFDATAGIFTTTTPEGRVGQTYVDSYGRIVVQSLPGIEPKLFSYDDQGRIEQIVQGSGDQSRVIDYVYGDDGWVEEIVDSEDRSVIYVRDLNGRVVEQTQPDGSIIGLGYDANNNVVSVTPPGRSEHRFDFTTTDLLSLYNPPDLASITLDTTSYQYARDDQIEVVTRPDGTVITYVYGDSGKLISKVLPNSEQVNFSYDEVTGQLVSVLSPNDILLGYTYDGSLLTDAVWEGDVSGSVHSDYNNNFQVVSQDVNGDVTAFTYDGDGMLESAGDLDITRDAESGMISGIEAGVVSSDIFYNGFGEMSSFVASVSDSTVFEATYERDRIGRITGLTEIRDGISTAYQYVYDLKGQLTDVYANGDTAAPLMHWDYDDNGNRLREINRRSGDEVEMLGSYDEQDRLISYGNDTDGYAEYSYTANGELASITKDGEIITYSYDVLGNLRFVILPDGTEIEYLVDGQNRRVGKKVNGALVQGFLYQDALNPIAELDGNGEVVSRFIYGTKVNVPVLMIRDGITYRIVSNHLGSPVAVYDIETGELAQRITYDEWGNILEDTNPDFQPFVFAGGLYDVDTAFVRFGARDYLSEIGRWTARDPILFKGLDSNLYRYANNDVVNNIDPTGNIPLYYIYQGLLWAASNWQVIGVGIGIASSMFPSYVSKKKRDYYRIKREAEEQRKIVEEWFDDAIERGDSQQSNNEEGFCPYGPSRADKHLENLKRYVYPLEDWLRRYEQGLEQVQSADDILHTISTGF